tara:strand:+ start:428145 stop:428576 length:432 start_codon:yes stop_codon:yes gene_type:complete
MRRILVIMAVTLGLAACGPMMETRYEFTPPTSKSGMQCVQNCQADQSMCQADARAAKERCREEADRKADRDYHKAKDDYIVALRLHAKDPAQFPEPREPYRSSPSYYQCDRLGAECTGQYNMCYRSCGGQIMEHQVCVANCDQ